jgi:transposase
MEVVCVLGVDKEPPMLQVHGLNDIPSATRKVAQAAFPSGSLAIAIRDELGPLYVDEQFQDLYSGRGQPAESPAQLALVTVLQFVEGLTDRQAADAVRGRIDWKYALGLDLSDPGFDYSVLSEFRARLIAGSAETRLLTTVLQAFQEKDLLKAGGRQRTDSTHVLAAIRQLNRLELVGETMRYVLNALTQTAPDWLMSVVLPDWYERYGRRFDSFHLPDSREKRQALVQQIGEDGYRLMTHALALETPVPVRCVPCIEVLRQIWIQQYYVDASEAEPRVSLRSSDQMPPAEKRILSPYDLDARYARHNDKEWVGYRTHCTETCDDDAPIHLITQVETVLAPIQDVEVTEQVHANLAAQGLTPKEHLVDAAYVSADLLAQSAQKESIELVGPVTKLQDVSWQAREQTGYDISQFQIDWDAKQVTCPNGQTATRWTENIQDRTGNAVIHVLFPTAICRTCSARDLCTRSKQGRSMQLRPQEQHEALQRVRAEQNSAEFKERYRPRLGIEGTISQAVRAFELCETRYRGLAKTHLQAVALATAINFCRFWDYLNGSGLVRTRTAPFAALAPS